MKKILGLVALTVAVAGTANAYQDYLKTMSVDSYAKYQYTDRKVDTEKEKDETSNNIGNEFFKKENIIARGFGQELTGTVVLKDELGLEADFGLTHTYTRDREGLEKLNSSERVWDPKLTIRKGFKFGDVEGNFKTSYIGSTTRAKKETTSITSTYVLGAEAKTKVFNQEVSLNTGAVYFNGNHGSTENYTLSRHAKLIDSRNDGWGADVKLGLEGTIAEGRNWGKVAYDVAFDNKFRQLRGHVLKTENNKTTEQKPGSNVKLTYTQNLKYTSPRVLGGFAGEVKLSNEWEKNTIRHGWKNSFDVTVKADYKAGIQTSIGAVTINPYVSYIPLNRETVKDENGLEKNVNNRLTTEKNTLRAGLNLTLDVK